MIIVDEDKTVENTKKRGNLGPRNALVIRGFIDIHMKLHKRWFA